MFNEKAIISKWNADMYDLNERDTEDVEFALSIIGTTSKNILEIACGSGRFLVPMAKQGILSRDLILTSTCLTKSGQSQMEWITLPGAKLMCSMMNGEKDLMLS